MAREGRVSYVRPLTVFPSLRFPDTSTGYQLLIISTFPSLLSQVGTSDGSGS